ncbi:Lsr2 family protein [Corynebacterium glyciniphilum]|uniref:histone-like nucleoid-structuring protein Lsr2 n=1 Tax=Corynebacterium glyciniphilum TaxID=1404244 RepID=UPI00264B7E5D|nr:Lsr2 family protein [Corynebacterium glyciniphilum]MDN5684096.1 Lsr2 family protein [Corynebacterium glyciniphilum]
MGRRTVMTFVDDIDQEELAPDEVRTVKFGYRGADYVLDLSELNAAILDEELEPYLGAARKLPKNASAGAGRSSSTSSSSASDAARNRRIRQWANENGREVSTRGKIAADVISDYEAAHPGDR